MEFEKQPIIYKCVESIYQLAKSKDMVKTCSRLQRRNTAMVTSSSKKICWASARTGSNPVTRTSGVFDPQYQKSGGHITEMLGTHPSNEGNDTGYSQSRLRYQSISNDS